MKYVIISAVLILVLTAMYFLYSYMPVKMFKLKKKCILCLGDSITFGAGVAMTRWKDSYPAILSRLVGKEYQILNYGISGATLIKGLKDTYRQDFMEKAGQIRPNICLFMLGTNDSKPQCWDIEKYERQLDEWLTEKAGNHTQVFVMIPPKAFEVNGEPVVYKIRDEIIAEEIKPVIIRQCLKHDVKVIDLYKLTENHPEYFMDGVHPNRMGNKAIAEEVYRNIKEYL